MNASMSSRRECIPTIGNGTTHAGPVSVLVFCASIGLAAVAVVTETPILAIPGFVGIAGPLMYWNALLWSSLEK